VVLARISRWEKKSTQERGVVRKKKADWKGILQGDPTERAPQRLLLDVVGRVLKRRESQKNEKERLPEKDVE